MPSAFARTWVLLSALSAAAAVGVGVLPVPRLADAAVTAGAGIEAESMSIPTDRGGRFWDPAASEGSALLLWSQATASAALTTPTGGQLVVRARADLCGGAPTMVVSTNGTVMLTVRVTATTWTDYAVPGAHAAGTTRVTVAYRGDHRTASCDRNLRLDRLSVQPGVPQREAESMSLTPGSGQAFGDASASAGAGLLLWSPGSASGTLTAPTGGQMVLRAKGEPCLGAPRVALALDGRTLATIPVEATTWQEHPLPVTWPGGDGRVEVSFVNDYAGGGCDRNVRLDWVAVRPVSVSPPSSGSPAPQPPPIWAEEFTTELDLTTPSHTGRWRANDVWQPVDRGYADFGAGGSTWNLNPQESIAGAPRSPFSVSEGALTITNRRTPTAWAADIAARNGGMPPPWSGGILITNTNRPSERFTYGYFEFRARLPNPAKGMFPALWLFAANGHNPGKENAEIDLLEVFGHQSGQPWSITLHQKKLGGTAAAGATTGSGQVPVATLAGDTTQWHTYGLDWQPDHLRFYKDGVLVTEITGADARFYNDVSMGLRLNYAADAAWFPRERISDASTPEQLRLDVDWIRVWKTKP